VEIKNRQKALLITAAAAIALLVGDSAVLGPLTDSWKARSDRVKQLQQSVAQGSLLLNQKRWITGRWDQMRTNTLPNDASLAENALLKAFDGWAKDSGIQIERITPQLKTEDEYTTLQCRADASGDIQTLAKFLYDAEKDVSKLALKVESVEISSRDSEGQKLSLGLQVSGLILSPQPQK
jgi:predicted Zn-dependent protease